MIPTKHPKPRAVMSTTSMQNPKSREPKRPKIRPPAAARHQPGNKKKKSWIDEVEIGDDEIYSRQDVPDPALPTSTPNQEYRRPLMQGTVPSSPEYQRNHVTLPGNVKRSSAFDSAHKKAPAPGQKSLSSPSYEAVEKVMKRSTLSSEPSLKRTRTDTEDALDDIGRPESSKKAKHSFLIPSTVFKSSPNLGRNSPVAVKPTAGLDDPWVWNVEKAKADISEPDASLGITYPPHLMASLEEQQTIATADFKAQIPKRNDWKKMHHTYPVYFASIEKNTESPFREVKLACFDLEKANTWAFVQFRRYIASRFPELNTTPHKRELEMGRPPVDESDWARHAWVKEEWCIRDQGRLGWFINKDGGVVLSAHLPRTNKQFTIRVESQGILK